MPLPHVIRLNRAWECRAAENGESLGRIDLPWPDAAEHSPDDAPLLLTRHFNRPPNLTPGQRVLLVLQPVELADEATFNDTRLAAGKADDDCICFDIAELLERHNRIHLLANPHVLASAEIHLVIQETES